MNENWVVFEHEWKMDICFEVVANMPIWSVLKYTHNILANLCVCVYSDQNPKVVSHMR